MPDAVVHKLERRLELSSVVAISISAMLGSGLFVLPGLAALKTGPSVWLAYLVAGLCVLPAALSKSELATAMPTSGGTYVYLDRTFGPLAGTVAGLGLWLSLLLKSAFALMGFGAYLLVLADVPLQPTALVLLVFVVVLNVRGVRRVAKAQTAIVGIALVSLVGLCALGGLHFDPGRLEPMFPEGPTGFVTAVGFVFVSYAGVTKVAAIAEEIKRPDRNLPAGILVSLVVVSFIYGAVTLVLVAVLPLGTLTGTLRPIHALAEAVGGTALGVPAAVLGVLTMTSMANAGLLAGSRFPFAMSRDKLLPHALHVLHPRFLTPVWSIVTSGAVMAVVIAFLDVESIAKLASAFMILIYATENLAVLVLRESRVRWYKPGWRAPLYPWVQIFGVLSSAALLAVMGSLAVWAILSIALPGILLYFSYGRTRTSRLGVVGLRGRRRDLQPSESVADVLEASSEGAHSIELDETPVEGSAEVLVALFGHERSPEMLVELGAALADGGKLEVVYITDIPEQTTGEALVEDDDKLVSVRRRVLAMRDMENVDLAFEAVLSRDVVGTVHDLTSRLHCQWLIKEFRGRGDDGGVTITNPLGWLKDHLPCNLAVYSDAGVRYLRRILVHTEPGSHDLLVARTADHLARLQGAEVTFCTWVPSRAPDEEEESAHRYLEEVKKLCATPSASLVVRGKRRAEAVGHASAGYDLLITAESPGGGLLGRLRGSRADRLTETAACSVLRLQSQGNEDHTGLAWEKPQLTPEAFALTSHLHPDCLGTRLHPASKQDLFQSLAQVFARALDVDERRVIAAFEERERLQSTGLGHGIAIPHGSLPELEETVLGVFTLSRPLDYQARDGRGVDVVFATLGPPDDRHTHLMLLAAVARLVVESDVVDRLRLAGDVHAMAEILEAASQRAVREESGLLAAPSSSSVGGAPALDDESVLPEPRPDGSGEAPPAEP